MSELRECPFCGGELTCVSGTGVDLMTQDNRPYIGCKVCEWTLSGRRLTEIAKIINCRPTEDTLRARITELEKKLAETEGYPGIAADMLKLKAENSRLRGAAQELLEAYNEPYPPYESGEIAQTAWCARREKAKKALAALTAAGEEGERDASN